MKDKFDQIYNKFYKTKCYSTIKQYCLDKTSIEVWKQIESQLEKEYLIIPNISMWAQDFIYGGTSDVYLIPSLFETYTHTRSVRQLNTFGGGVFGDIMTLLRSFNDYHASCINLRDFGTFIQILSIMVVYSFFRERQSRLPETNFTLEVIKMCDWLTRNTVAQLTIPKENSHTVYNIHYPNAIESACIGNTFDNVMKDFTKYSKGKAWVTPELYRSTVVGTYYEYVGNMKVKDGFVKPNIIFHEAVCTEMEQEILSSDKFEKIAIAMEYLQGLGVDGVIKKFKISEKDNTEEKLFNITNPVEFTHNVLHSRKTNPDGVTYMLDNPCKVDYTQLTQTPLATCIINADKLIFENSTKSHDWIIQTLVFMYTHAQDINKLRLDVLSEHPDRPLLVIIKLTDDKLKDELTSHFNNITESFKSAFELNFTYKFVGEL